jgi:hypothetical protein
MLLKPSGLYSPALPEDPHPSSTASAPAAALFARLQRALPCIPDAANAQAMAVGPIPSAQERFLLSHEPLRFMLHHDIIAFISSPLNSRHFISSLSHVQPSKHWDQHCPALISCNRSSQTRSRASTDQSPLSTPPILPPQINHTLRHAVPRRTQQTQHPLSVYARPIMRRKGAIGRP